MYSSFVLTILILFTGIRLSAQTTASNESFGTDTVESRSFRHVHLGFIYPISSNGVDAGQIANRFSFQLLAGYGGGLYGFGLAGLVNLENGSVRGFQAAGLGNIVLADVSGVQMAGLFNISLENSRVTQFAGLCNIVNDSISGAQFAGLVNFSNNRMQGFQSAGLLNVILQQQQAFQLAGLGNYSKKGAGAQIAGLFNISGDFRGTQLAGLLNVAQKVKGVQIGLLNVADSVSGVSIGFLSFVRKGYRRLEVVTQESIHTQLMFKMGVSQFYNILGIGYHISDHDPFQSYSTSPTWSYGYGIGSEISLQTHWKVNLELMCYDVIEQENNFHHKELNLLNQARILFVLQPGKRFSLVFGPSFNVMTSKLRDSDGNLTGSSIAPWTVYDHSGSKVNLKMWPGFELGLRF